MAPPEGKPPGIIILAFYYYFINRILLRCWLLLLVVVVSIELKAALIVVCVCVPTNKKRERKESEALNLSKDRSSRVLLEEQAEEVEGDLAPEARPEEEHQEVQLEGDEANKPSSCSRVSVHQRRAPPDLRVDVEHHADTEIHDDGANTALMKEPSLHQLD